MVKKPAHKYFGIIVFLIAAIIFGMIYFLSMTQAKEDEKSELLKDKLNQQITTTKGIEASVQQITEENEALKASVTEKDNEIIGLYKKNVTLSSFSEMLVLYINRTNDERIKTIISTINRNELTTEQLTVLDMISAEINESAEENNAVITE